MTDRPAEHSLSLVAGWLLSLLFWSSLGISMTLAAILILSPRWLQNEQLRSRYLRNFDEISRLSHESQHLSRVIQALQTDPEFVARVAASELQVVPTGNIQIPLEASLEFDSRVLHSIPQKGALPAIRSDAWFLPWVEMVAQSPTVRTRLGIVAATLLLLAFFCFNEGFFAGSLGEIIRRIGHRIGRRYCVEK